MNRQTIGTVLKYGLALGLMAWVIWNAWGDPRGTAGKVIVGGGGGRATVTGTVVGYGPDATDPATTVLAIQEASGQRTEFALKPNGGSKDVGPDDAPLPEAEALRVGTTVTVAEVSRGLAYVWKRHAEEGKPVHTGFLALAFLFGSGSLLITFLRWYFLVRAGGLPFRVLDALRLGFIGFFFNTFLPGAVGGDIIKAAFLAREQRRRTVAVATVIMDRAIALWALVWFVALLGTAFWLGGLLEGEGSAQCRTIVTTAWVIVAASLLAWALLGLLPGHRAERFAGRLSRLPRVGGSAAEFWRAAWMYRCRPRSVFGVLALSWVGHVGFVLLFYCSARTLWDADSGQEIPTFFQHFLIVPIGLVIQAVPLFPGGAGIGELGFGKLYSWLGCSEASGVLASLVQRVVTWGLGLVSYGFYRRMRVTLPAPETSPAELVSAEA